jgi:alkaline phosphatase D
VGGGLLNRREALAAGAAAAAALGVARTATGATRSGFSAGIDFGSLGPGDGWPGWSCPGAATLRREGGRGTLVAATDVFPCDPRPVAFLIDRRFRDGEVEATLTAAGAGAGVVLRRVGPRDCYAAVYDDEEKALVVLRRSPAGEHELARAAVLRIGGPLRISLTAAGARPTTLTARLHPGAGLPVEAIARDSAPVLQRDGDAGVLATARSIFPSEGPAGQPPAANARLTLGTQEGAAFLESPAGQQLVARSRERSTAAFSAIAVRAAGHPQPTPASVVGAATGRPVRRGAVVRVAADLPARVTIEVALDPRFRRGRRRLRPVRTNSFDAVLATAARLPPGQRVYWRARLRRRGRETVGPVRSFRVLPRAGSGARTRIAIASCAAHFGPAFDQIAARRPDAFVWQGDLNYPDTMGPMAQTVPAYAGIWRDFLVNPRMEDILERTLFAAQRDDHDYGVQDANSTNLVPWGLAPWEALMERRLYYRLSAGLADVWVLDQRRHKTDPEAADTPAKTLLGRRQRDWLLRGLAASRAPFKVICSPCTLAPLRANERDGSWAAGYAAERDLLLAHVRDRVAGQTVFVTGDTHWTMAYDRDGLFEARPCPLGIPTPNDITLTQPHAAEEARTMPGVAYADDDKGHVAFLEVSGRGRTARLDLALVREDGATPYRRRFEEPRTRRV